MTRAFLVADSDDMPVPDAEETDFSAVDPLADFVGDSRECKPKVAFRADEAQR